MPDKDSSSVIVTDPNILGGAYPVFRGTRVPFRNLLDHLKEGGSIDTFPIDFPTVTRAQAVDALEYAEESLPLCH